MKKNFFKGVIDTTFREGQQSPLLFDHYKYHFNLEEKKKIFKGLLRLGVRVFEFFSPVVSSSIFKEFKALKKIADKEKNKGKVLFLAHCRIKEEDFASALKAGFDGLNFYLNLNQDNSPTYSRSIDDLVKEAVFYISKLRKNHPLLYLRFSAEDGFRANFSYVIEIYKKLASFVNTFGLPDTVGIATPDLVKTRVKILKRYFPTKNIEVHFHNDRGLSLINAIEAVKNGASFVDTTVWGMGERSGITSVTAFLLNLFLEDPSLVEEYNLKLCYPLNVLLGSILGTQVPFNEPVSLTNRTHIAGVHQKAVIKRTKIYEAINLEQFGVEKNYLLLGPLTGSNLIFYYLKEIKGYQINKTQAIKISREFRAKFEKGKITDPEKELVALVDKKKFKKTEINLRYKKRRLEIF